MATYELDNRAAPEDTRPLLVRGKRYHYKTATICPVCNGQHNMYVKSIQDNSCVLECPFCDNYHSTKIETVKRVEE